MRLQRFYFRRTTLMQIALWMLFVVGLSAIQSAIGTVHAGEPTTPTTPTIVILLQVHAPDGTIASFGTAGTDEIVPYSSIRRALLGRGFSIVSAAGVAVTRVGGAEDTDANVLSDASAGDLARQLGADTAIIVSMVGTAEGRIRGTALRGAVVSGEARMLDVADGRILMTASGKGADFAKNDSSAIEKASRKSGDILAEALGTEASKRWAPPLAVDNRLTIVVKGATSWASVSAIMHRLATSAGVAAVHPREVRGNKVILAIDTELPASKMASLVRGARLFVGSLSTTVKDDVVMVSVQGDAR